MTTKCRTEYLHRGQAQEECWRFVDSYRRVIRQAGQIKMGHPHLVCFKTVVAAIAKQMDEGTAFDPEDRFAVILDRGDFDIQAVQAFNRIKDDPNFLHRHRLETCIPAEAEKFIGLQPADFVAYEGLRLMHGKRNGVRRLGKQWILYWTLLAL